MARRIAPMTVDQVLTASARSLAKARDGELEWTWRIRLADAVNRTRPNDSLWRQQALAYLAARETLPAFLELEPRLPAKFHGLPQRFLVSTQRVLLGLEPSSRKATADIHNEDQIEAAQESDPPYGPGIFAIWSTYSALPFHVERQEAMYREYDYDRVWNADYRLTEFSDEKVEIGSWDNHYWCSLVAAGFGGTDKASIGRRRAF
jgi:hypothetical protein